MEIATCYITRIIHHGSNRSQYIWKNTTIENSHVIILGRTRKRKHQFPYAVAESEPPVSTGAKKALGYCEMSIWVLGCCGVYPSPLAANSPARVTLSVSFSSFCYRCRRFWHRSGVVEHRFPYSHDRYIMMKKLFLRHIENAVL